MEAHISSMQNITQAMRDAGAVRLYVKPLAENDNSKNQIYLGSDFSSLNILPNRGIKPDTERGNFKAALDLAWIDQTGTLFNAPHSQLILYPQYPEVRMSGFLKGCQNPPSALMAARMAGRLLFLSITAEEKIIAYVAGPDSVLVHEYNGLPSYPQLGVFFEIPLENTRKKLLAKLRQIHLAGWLNSSRLDSNGLRMPCAGTNCGGYTLEAELGIIPNGRSSPDYLGWEVKQFKVNSFASPRAMSPVTLMTPEPTGGYYTEAGIIQFVTKYGYKDTKGREDRLNFGGVHSFGNVQKRTQLRLVLSKYNEVDKTFSLDGGICLLDENGEEAATWDYKGLMQHWSRKHAQAVYVPSLRQSTMSSMQYFYGNNVSLGEGTDFLRFLSGIAAGDIVYDPGIKLENVSSSHPTAKKRSQFRIKADKLNSLYNQWEIVNLLDV